MAKWTYLFLSVIFLLPSQWNSPSMFYQEAFDHPGWDIVRVASSWRVLHSYGVFPPKKMPMIKPVARWEINGGQKLDYYYQISGPTSVSGHPPFLVAPLRFPRFDYIYGFYAASHVWSLVTRLGPAWGTGEEYIESVASMLLLHPERASWYFDTNAIMPETVQLFVVGLVPDWQRKWTEISAELDREWSGQQIPINSILSPLMTVLHRRRRIDQNIIAEDPPVSIEYSRQFGGYIGCLTFAHLVPLSFHSLVCRDILRSNRNASDSKYRKIPISDFVYSLLDI